MCHIMLNAIKSSKKGRTNIMGHVMEHNLLFPNFQLFAGFPSSDLSPKESEVDFSLVAPVRFAKKLSGRKVSCRPVGLHL